MLEMLKLHINQAIEQWRKEINKSPERKHRIDMSTEFRAIFQKFIVHVLFGEDIDSSSTVTIMVRNDQSKPFKSKSFTLSEAI